MLTVEQALSQMLASADALADVESIPTLQACGRVLATNVVAAMQVPPMDNSQMDGYAVRSLDVPAAPTTLRVSQRIAAGHVGAPLEPGTAARIFTGAPVPPGADAIVMQEACVASGDKVTINERPAAGAWVRRAGVDVEAGQTVLAAGTRLRPQDLGLAASVGVGDLTVHRRLRVAVFFTGDELMMPGEPLPPGRIYNSNRFVLRGLLEKLGCEVLDLGIVPDDRQRTREAFASAAVGADLIITSGGVSVGEEDHIKPAVEAEGRLEMWQIAMKPGKPLAFGHVRDVPFIGLPGNPVSAMVTFMIMVRPFVQRLQGISDVTLRSYAVRADSDWQRPDVRAEFLRGRINGEGGVELYPNQGSGVVTSLCWGDGLVMNPPALAFKRGDIVRFVPFAELLS